MLPVTSYVYLFTFIYKQDVTLTERYPTGSPCSVGHVPGAQPPAALQTTTDASDQNNTGPLGGPVTKEVKQRCIFLYDSTITNVLISCIFQQC